MNKKLILTTNNLKHNSLSNYYYQIFNYYKYRIDIITFNEKIISTWELVTSKKEHEGKKLVKTWSYLVLMDVLTKKHLISKNLGGNP